ncbi:MAG TPA: sulfotransferase [Gaiellaceae bacterium]|nr:sulfotransferase [Gaiellaceae bacterium]
MIASLYGGSAARVAARRRTARGSEADAGARPVFVVGSPRSGTTFVGRALGAQPGLIDLGEVKPLKARAPELAGLPEEEAAARLRRTVEIVRGLGLARNLRAVEQTPEASFVVGAALRAYPQGRAVHALRDGRDVVCSLLERGWLSAGRGGADDARQAFGAHARFWVEEERREEFVRASDATRCAWAWRRYVTAARASLPRDRVSRGRMLELRYEQLVTDPQAAAARLAGFLELEPGPLARALATAHTRSLGRWRRDLSREQLADVEREAGPLLAELGYGD